MFTDSDPGREERYAHEVASLLEQVFSAREQIFLRLVAGDLFPSLDSAEQTTSDIYRYEMGADDMSRDPVLRIRFGGSHQLNPYVEIDDLGVRYCESFTSVFEHVEGKDAIVDPSELHVAEEAERAIACLQALIAD